MSKLTAWIITGMGIVSGIVVIVLGNVIPKMTRMLLDADASRTKSVE